MVSNITYFNVSISLKYESKNSLIFEKLISFYKVQISFYSKFFCRPKKGGRPASVKP
jgi:hypothetical protein